MFSFSFVKSINASNHVCSRMVPVWNHSSFNLPQNVYITETQEINSTYPYESNPKDIFILHLMSTSKDFRIKKFLQFSKNF